VTPDFSQMEHYPISITGPFLAQELALDLYADPGACMFEGIRNGLIASMDGDTWAPQKARIEVFFEHNHPLCPQTNALVILDHGSGFTDMNIKRFSTIGRDPKNVLEFKGAQQKRIGRFAMLALNKQTVAGNYETGFFVITKTKHQAKVRIIYMIPNWIQQAQNWLGEQVPHNSGKLGRLKTIEGSFTAIVIPNPVLETEEQIRQAIRWKLPRKKELMFDLEVCGKKLLPPALANRITVVQEKPLKEGGRIEAYIDQTPEKEDGGIWLADADTGLRVADLSKMSSHVPHPLWRPELWGDIFVPRVLGNQDTGRTSLSSQLLKTAYWRNTVYGFLSANVAPKARVLIGDEDVFKGNDPISSMIGEFVDSCKAAFGDPEKNSGGPAGLTRTASQTHRTTGPRKEPGPTRPHEPGKTRVIPVRVADQDYYLTPRQLDPLTMAEASLDTNNNIIFINNRGYSALPNKKFAAQEHIKLRILEAVGRAKYPNSAAQVSQFISENRSKMQK